MEQSGVGGSQVLPFDSVFSHQSAKFNMKTRFLLYSQLFVLVNKWTWTLSLRVDFWSTETKKVILTNETHSRSGPTRKDSLILSEVTVRSRLEWNVSRDFTDSSPR